MKTFAATLLSAAWGALLAYAVLGMVPNTPPDKSWLAHSSHIERITP